jgi:hypothetical protein
METRKYVLWKTLQLEYLTRILLIRILRLNPSKHKAVGHSSRALGLVERLQFLIDFELISEKEKTKILWLLQIRNQMMHNLEASSFVECLKYTDAGLNAESLLKAFPSPPKEKVLPIENRLHLAFGRLCRHVGDQFVGLPERVTKMNR